MNAEQSIGISPGASVLRVLPTAPAVMRYEMLMERVGYTECREGFDCLLRGLIRSRDIIRLNDGYALPRSRRNAPYTMRGGPPSKGEKIYIGICGHPVSSKKAKRCKACHNNALRKPQEKNKMKASRKKIVNITPALPTFDDHRDLLLASQERQIEALMVQMTFMRDALRNIQADSNEPHIVAMAADGLLGIL